MTTDQEWWRGSVTYQIYPRSFQDDNADGMGDLQGIIRRLPHVADMGVDAIWLSPFFTSPMADMGYDVSDHRDVDPTFGTLADFDALVARAHELGLKVIIDQVLSHSSDRHPFFQESRSSRSNAKADWYVWHDARPEGSPPNNWQSIFGGPAWTWDVRRRQYYFHQFLKEQPDLNFHNPEVQDWALDTLRFWLDRGVDGFRLDAVNHYVHDAELRDNPPDIREKSEPDYKTFEMQYPIHSKNRPENLTFIERVRALTDSYDARTLIGEIGEAHHPVERLQDYTGPGRLHQAYHTALMHKPYGAAFIRSQLEEMFRDGYAGCPNWAFSSHDVPRHVSRWADYAATSEAFAKMTCALLLSLRGSVCLYQGEELGLEQTELDYDELVDPEGKTFYPENPGRDGSRTPMPWTADAPQAGFSEAPTTWLPIKPTQARRAVDRQEGDPESVLSFYKRMIALRRERPALRSGGMRFLDLPPPLLGIRRGDDTLCVFNLDPVAAEAEFSGMGGILASEGVTCDGAHISFAPNGFVIAETGG
ncbi:alpha-amylase family glycosyl hydrolase [Tranquillimonas rosea]|uniref:alpha-amylase family glycosyl hydrolase n=1 Tax=Tranquillimonas rosea TaxID=641238 RepID=UPI003BAD6B0C